MRSCQRSAYLYCWPHVVTPSGLNSKDAEGKEVRDRGEMLGHQHRLHQAAPARRDLLVNCLSSCLCSQPKRVEWKIDTHQLDGTSLTVTSVKSSKNEGVDGGDGEATLGQELVLAESSPSPTLTSGRMVASTYCPLSFDVSGHLGVLPALLELVPYPC